MTNKLFYLNILAYILLYTIGFFNGKSNIESKTINLSELDIEKQLIVDNFFSDYGHTADVMGVKQGNDTLWTVELFLLHNKGQSTEVLISANGFDLEGTISDLLYYLKDNLKNDDWNRKTLKTKNDTN